MHKPFYASGFLYHRNTNQILLQQLTQEEKIHFGLFRNRSINGHDPLTVFRLCLEEALKTKVEIVNIFPVYDYVHERLGENFIFFAEISGAHPPVFTSEFASEWIPLPKVSKYPMSSQTRHDLIIAERVIRHLGETQNSPTSAS